MTKIEELEVAVVSLTDDEYVRFRQWFLDRDWEHWDRQIEQDCATGKLDFLVTEAAEAKKNNSLRDL